MHFHSSLHFLVGHQGIVNSQFAAILRPAWARDSTPVQWRAAMQGCVYTAAASACSTAVLPSALTSNSLWSSMYIIDPCNTGNRNCRNGGTPKSLVNPGPRLC
jgi:hypothetical protein